MKRAIHVLIVLVIVMAICLINPLKAKADWYLYDALYLTLNDDGESFTVTGCFTEVMEGEVHIPELYRDKPVIAIADNVFSGCSEVTKVVVPKSVTSIGTAAFANCSKLTEVELHEGLTSIGTSAFFGCEKLEKLDIPDSVTSFGSGVFYGCESLKEINIPEGVPSIGSQMFQSCKSLTEVKLPNSVTSIGESAFWGCNNIKKITIGNRVTAIGNNAFVGCLGLTDIVIPDSVVSLGESAFSDCSGLKSVTLSKGLTKINKNTFLRCSSLADITIGGKIAVVDYAAFSGCRSLKNLTIGNSVTTLGNMAFEGCSSLTSVTIGSGVTSLGNDVFGINPSLTDIYYAGTRSQWEQIEKGSNDAFLTAKIHCLGSEELEVICGPVTYLVTDGKAQIVKCDTNASGVLAIPAQIYGCPVTAINEKAFHACKNLTEVVLPDSITSIGMNAFLQCSALEKIYLPSNLDTIGGYAFNYCTSLSQVYLPEGLTQLGSSAFQCCESLTEIYIPGSAVNSKDYVFNSCSNLKSVVIGDGITTIGSGMFMGCNELTDVYIPASVKSIGQFTFNSNRSAMNIYYAGTASQWSQIDIQKYNNGLNAATIHYNSEMPEKPAAPEKPALPNCDNGHQNDAGTIIKESTCSEAGIKAHKCLLCGEIVDTESLPTLEHTYDKGTVSKKPTCAEFGEALYTCQRCGETKTETMSKSKTHNYQSVITQATLSKDGAVEEKCAGCGKVKSSSVVIRPATFALHTTSYAYDGQAKKPVVTVQDADGNYLVKGKDYEVTYSGGCTNPGTHQVIITMTGKYAGSKTLTFEIKGKATITTQPKTAKVAVGKAVKFTIKATGDGLKYQWQSSSNGKTWKNCSSSSATKATFSFTSKTTHNGNYYRCKVTDSAGNVVYSNTVRAYVLGVTTQPKTVKVEAGDDIKLTAKATGTGLKYQWQSSTNGKTWKNCSSSSAKKATFSFTSKTSHNGNYYRCKITDSAGNVVYTDTVRAYVLGITEQPVSKTVTKGKTAKFTVEATGASKVYQWQVSTDGGKTWKNCSSTSAKKATFSFTAKASHNGNYYRCRIKDSGGNTVYTNKVKLTVK